MKRQAQTLTALDLKDFQSQTSQWEIAAQKLIDGRFESSGNTALCGTQYQGMVPGKEAQRKKETIPVYVGLTDISPQLDVLSYEILI